MEVNQSQSSPSCVHAFISGRVQRVGYRYNTRERAIALNLTGWVRNLPDGRVEAVVVGESAQIDNMVDWFRSGPAGANVTAVETKEQAVQTFSGFEIRR